jgi:hypothetical protein
MGESVVVEAEDICADGFRRPSQHRDGGWRDGRYMAFGSRAKGEVSFAAARVAKPSAFGAKLGRTA